MKRPLAEAEAVRAQELLLDRAMHGLLPAEPAELAALGADSDDSFDLAAAALDVATLRLEAMPAGVADRLLAAAVGAGAGAGAARSAAAPALPQTLAGVVPARAIDTRPPRLAEPEPEPVSTQDHAPTSVFTVSPPSVSTLAPAPAPAPAPALSPSPVSARSPAPAPVQAHVQAPVIPIRRSRAPVIAGWLAAAACLALAVGAVLWARGQKPATVATTAPSQARVDLLASAGDAATLAWKPTADAAAQGASGDVVWSPSKQRGYMRFRGLAPNDPKVSQYQLWIFDQQRDEQFPVDGGVFDVASTGEVIVPISPKLQVGAAVLFAVTVERPGGVVVSKRERIVVTAAPT